MNRFFIVANAFCLNVFAQDLIVTQGTENTL